MLKNKCPISDQVCEKRVMNLQSNPKGLLLIKKFLKKILKKGVICPDLYINENIDFAFFPRPSEAFLNHYYTFTEEKNIKQWKKFSNSQSMKDTANFVMDKVHELGYSKKLHAESKILDYGCGTGWFSFSLINQYKKIYALDFNKELLNYLSDQSNKIINVIRNYEIKNYHNYFDLVFSFDVFEHLSDPLSQVIQINNAIKKDGICIICVPNFNSYFFKVNISKHPYFSYPSHLNYFSVKSIEYMMAKAGFKDVKVLDVTFPWEKIYIMPDFYKKELFNKKELIEKKGWHLNDDWEMAGNGEHLICICRK